MLQVDDSKLQEGKMYKFDGQNFIEVEFDRSVTKVPITAEADEALKKMRNLVAKAMPARPDLSIVASAVIIHAVGLDGLVDIVKSYGAKLYQS